jgi:hypothetical protein
MVIKLYGIMELLNFLTIRYSKTIANRDWIDAGFVFVRDLFDKNGLLKSFEYFRQRVKHTGNIFLQYFALCNALPRDWKDVQILAGHIDDRIIFDSVPN